LRTTQQRDLPGGGGFFRSKSRDIETWRHRDIETYESQAPRLVETYENYDRFHWKCYTPEIHQIQKLKFLRNSNSLRLWFNLNLYKFKLNHSLKEFVPRDTEKSEFLNLMDFGGVAMSMESVRSLRSSRDIEIQGHSCSLQTCVNLPITSAFQHPTYVACGHRKFWQPTDLRRRTHNLCIRTLYTYIPTTHTSEQYVRRNFDAKPLHSDTVHMLHLYIPTPYIYCTSTFRHMYCIL